MSKSVIGIVAAMLAIMVGVSLVLWRVSGELAAVSAQVKAQQEPITQALKSVDGRMVAVGDRVSQQSGLIYRALGKVLPVTLPDDVQTRFKSLEHQLMAESAAPRSAVEVEQIRKDLADIVGALPPWIQEELLPRLVPMRWTLEAQSVLTRPPTGKRDELAIQETNIEQLLDNRPLETSDILAKALEERRAALEAQIAELDRSEALARADEIMRDPNMAGDPGAVISLLSVYEDAEAKERVRKLNQSLLVHSLRDAIKATQDDVVRAQASVGEPLKEYAIGRAHEATMDLELKMLSSKIEDPALNKDLAELIKTVAVSADTTRKARRSREAEQLKNYQVWALKRIQQVRQYKAIESAELARISSTVDRINPASQAHRTAIRRAQQALRQDLVTLLGPIDQGLLDLSVSEWFRKVYQQRFEQLTDEREQLAVVTGFASTPKTSVEFRP